LAGFHQAASAKRADFRPWDLFPAGKTFSALFLEMPSCPAAAAAAADCPPALQAAQFTCITFPVKEPEGIFPIIKASAGFVKELPGKRNLLIGKERRGPAPARGWGFDKNQPAPWKFGGIDAGSKINPGRGKCPAQDQGGT